MGVGAAAQPGPLLPPGNLIHCTQVMVRGTPPEHSTKVEPPVGEGGGFPVVSRHMALLGVQAVVAGPCSGVELVMSLSSYPPWNQSLHM